MRIMGGTFQKVACCRGISLQFVIWNAVPLGDIYIQAV
jgi:hypothetical protein